MQGDVTDKVVVVVHTYHHSSILLCEKTNTSPH